VKQAVAGTIQKLAVVDDNERAITQADAITPLIPTLGAIGANRVQQVS
jgi:hypothetical protein